MNNTNNPDYEILHQTALKAPSSSGVYLWRNAAGTVIYVGKAKSLKNRLTSYFSGERQIKTQLLVSNAKSIEYITTNNEYEAFLLENNLIKKYSPRYNIQLKDGKSYPVLKITNEDFPRFYKTRQIRHDGSAYFGPYPDASALDTFIDTLYKIYPVRHCRTLKKREAPCMYYHIGRCKAPCCGKIDKQSYNEFIEEIKALLKGKDEKNDNGTIQKITAEMKAAAAQLNFEKAARLRDGLRALTIMQNQNIVEGFDSEDRDYIAHYREGELVSFTVLKLRGGKLTGRDNFRVESLADDSELLEEFASKYYADENSLPAKIYVSAEDSVEMLEKWVNSSGQGPGGSGQESGDSGQGAVVRGQEPGIREQGAGGSNAVVEPAENTSNEITTGKGISLRAAPGRAIRGSALTALHSKIAEAEQDEKPGNFGTAAAATTIPNATTGSGAGRTQIIKISPDDISSNRRDVAVLEMAEHNAKEDIIRRMRERGDMPALNELKELLYLPRLPHRIEGFDIAHIGGKFPVASLISFWDGNPDKKNYRYFRLKTTNGVIDDFASMREATSRRYSRLANEGKPLPDLILIDGGIGQVNAVDGILRALDLDIPIAGLAKRDEEIWRPHASKPICLPRRSDALRLLQRVRDETHRFATSRNQNLRTKENTVSAFISLPHIGEKREKILIKTFSTLENLAAAQESEIAQALHVRAGEASDILVAAKALAEKRTEDKEQKEMFFQSQLGQNQTARTGDSVYASRLASLALDEDEMKVAEKNGV